MGAARKWVANQRSDEVSQGGCELEVLLGQQLFAHIPSTKPTYCLKLTVSGYR